MRRGIVRMFVLGSVVLLAGCASSQEWSEWYDHRTHFASGDHASFSLRNQSGPATRVTRLDVEHARTEAWWGQPVTVASEQIIQN